MGKPTKSAAPLAKAPQASSPWYSKENLLKARLPLGFVMHIGAMLLMEYVPIVLQLPCVALLWWELAKEFPKYRTRTMVIMTGLNYLDLYLLKTIPGVPIWQIALGRAIVLAIGFHFVGLSRLDSIFLNYLLVGITAVLTLFERYPIQVMLTISMSIAGSDCFQYFSGKLFGRTKIVPTISPNKSLEGYVFAMVVCIAIYYLYLADYQMAPLDQGLLYVVVMIFLGIVGDLFQSWWKRNHRIKDSSHILGAHGGFLDRLDSHLAAWLWSTLYARVFFGDAYVNFTGMDYGRIINLIIGMWVLLWGYWIATNVFGISVSANK